MIPLLANFSRALNTAFSARLWCRIGLLALACILLAVAAAFGVYAAFVAIAAESGAIVAALIVAAGLAVLALFCVGGSLLMRRAAPAVTVTVPAPPVLAPAPDLLMTLARMGIALGRRDAGRDQGPPPIALIGVIAVLGYLAGRRM